MSVQDNRNRPISPFMLGSLYRWQISSITSTFHRITGVALFFSFALISLWLIGAAAGGAWQNLASALIESWFGKLVLFLSLLALWYHFLNGIRHLAWDFGWGFDLFTARITGFIVLIGALVMTIITAIAL